jgi:hypothetical protein
MYDEAFVTKQSRSSNGFGPLGAVTLHSSGIKGNKINCCSTSICQATLPD